MKRYLIAVVILSALISPAWGQSGKMPIDQLAAYTDAVLSGTPPPVSGADGRAGVAAALALLDASRTRQVVALC